jgi:hypothetical protein
MIRFNKDPDAKLDYLFDWTAWLGTDTIATATVTVPTGITLALQTNTTTTVTAWLSGGTVNATYEIKCHIITAAGRIDDRTMSVQIVQK